MLSARKKADAGTNHTSIRSTKKATLLNPNITNIMEKLINTITLMAKTGLFFASADGDYSDKEKNFIEGFISGIENIGDIDDELKAKVNDATSHTYTLDEIVKETQQLLEGFSPDEQSAIKKSLKAFVNKVIDADCERKGVEQENYLAWKKAIM